MAVDKPNFGDRMAKIKQERLKSPRQELFAQGVAKGKPRDRAYAEAGFSDNPSNKASNAARMSGNERVAARIAMLQAAAAEDAVVTASALTAWLTELAVEAQAIGDAAGFSVARNSVMDIAKLAGLITDKVQREDLGKLAPRPTPETALANLKAIGEANGVMIQ